MNSPTSDLLTLLGWAQRLAAGQRCAQWEAWCASSPSAAWQWERITRAQELLEGAGGDVQAGEDIPPEQMAAFVEGRLNAAELSCVEAECWRSTALLAEALSAVRFAHQSLLLEVSSELENRLLALGSNPQNRHTNSGAPRFQLAHGVVEEVAGSKTDEQPAPSQRWLHFEQAKPQAATAEPRSAPSTVRQSHARWHWPLVATALLVVATVSGGLGWLIATRYHVVRSQQPVAQSQAAQVESPRPTDERPSEVQIVNPRDSSTVPPEGSNSPPPEPAPPPSSAVPSEPEQSSPANKRPPSSPTPLAPPADIPRIKPRVPVPPPELAFRSAQGLMLVDAGGGTWRVAQGERALVEPLTLVSLAESWTSVEISQLGTLICDGPARLTLAMQADGLVELRLVHGRLGIQGLPTTARIHLQTANATWTARGMGRDSSLAVVHDPLAPSLLVSAGAVAVDNLDVSAGQIVRWQDGAFQPLQSASSSAAGSGTIVARPALGDPLDLTWLQPPDENRRKQWRTLHGRLIDRLAAANDAGEELRKLLSASRDARQAALLSQWSVAIADEAGRARQTWEMLIDRRELVRIAGVKCLLELPPGDPRLVNLLRLLRQELGDVATDRMMQWFDGARQPAPLAATQAAELADHLLHRELAVRQVAVSLLELHVAPALTQAGVPLPSYDAAGPPGRRTAGQMEWLQMLRQLYTPTRKMPAALGPAAVAPAAAAPAAPAAKAAQPVLAPKNAAPVMP